MRTLVTLMALSATVAAQGPPPTTPEVALERDQLIDRITRGVDVEASTRRLAELVAARDKVVATSAAALARQEAAEQVARAESQRRYKLREAYHVTGDYNVSKCVLSPDPLHPTQVIPHEYPVDWGKVVRKEKTRLQPKNALDEGEPVTMYEIAGQVRRYHVHGETMTSWSARPLVAEVGDLVVICVTRAGYDPGRSDDNFMIKTHSAPVYPPAWSQPVQRSGVAVRVSRPPLIVEKARWKPLHISRNFIGWAVRDVRWKHPEDRYVVANVEVDADLGGGRFRMRADEDLTWILEVPPSVKRRELLQVGHEVWVLMGHPRFDRALRKLVLTAEEIDERYIFER